ncbi:MAG: NIPSNAP family protein [Fuerstiella sp.]
MNFDQLICRTFAGVMLSSFLFCPTQASADVYELRTYTTNEGKLDNLNARFRDHTVQLFTKHGMESVGYWVPTNEPKAKNTLIYVLKHKDRSAAAASWKAFLADPEWKTVARESQIDGRILAKAPDSVFMNATDYTPAFANKGKGDDAVFELRIYRCNEDKLSNLDSRFRDHTIRIFTRHGLQSVAYWHPADEPGSKDTLIYILRHEGRDAAKAAWKSFGGDQDWKKVAKESQKDGRFLRERPESIYMKATDYSAIQ